MEGAIQWSAKCTGEILNFTLVLVSRLRNKRWGLQLSQTKELISQAAILIRRQFLNSLYHNRVETKLHKERQCLKTKDNSISLLIKSPVIQFQSDPPIRGTLNYRKYQKHQSRTKFLNLIIDTKILILTILKLHSLQMHQFKAITIFRWQTKIIILLSLDLIPRATSLDKWISTKM